jgi:ABC-type bacteriocin/lantibiotic exporter with double-glycine peptidase domain
MKGIIFWTDKRLETLSKTFLTLFQGFLLAAVLGGVFGKIESFWLKVMFIASMVVFFILGIVFADKIKE